MAISQPRYWLSELKPHKSRSARKPETAGLAFQVTTQATFTKQGYRAHYTERLVSNAEIAGHCNTNLLGGGRSGSVSLNQKTQREKNAAARMHKATMALCDEADRMLKPALTGNRTFSGLEEDDLMQESLSSGLSSVLRPRERGLQVIVGDVIEQYYLEQGRPEQSFSLASLAIEDK